MRWEDLSEGFGGQSNLRLYRAIGLETEVEARRVDRSVIALGPEVSAQDGEIPSFPIGLPAAGLYRPLFVFLTRA